MATRPNDPKNQALADELRRGRAAVADRDRKVMVLTGGQPGESRTYRFDKERIVLGSVVSADVRITGDGVEPIHAVVELTPEPMIYDLASGTGVFINGAKVVAQPLKNGDEITIGRAYLKFSVDSRTTVAQSMGTERVRWTEAQGLFLNPDEDFKPLLLEEEADDIFDYRPAQKAALEVVMSWHGTVLDIEHFVREKAVTVGVFQKSHFGIPPLLSASNHPIVTRNDQDFILNLDRQMKGVMFKGGKLMNMEQMLSSSLKGEHGFQVPIGREDFAKITIGEVDFFFSFTEAPPRLKRGRWLERDVLFYKIFSASLLMTGLTLYGLNQIKVVAPLEADQIPERLATILYSPEKYEHRMKEPITPAHNPDQVKPPELTKPPQPIPHPTVKLEIHPNRENEHHPIPKTMDTGDKQSNHAHEAHKQKQNPSKAQGAAREGKGAKAQGTSGTRGTKTAALDRAHQNAAAVPSPNGGPGKGSSNSQAADVGNVDFLKGATGRIENILSGAGAHLSNGGEKLKGLSGFDTRGNGGLALSGDGKGGGGTSELSKGLGDSGRGQGRVGTGLGAAGNGNGIIGGQARVAIRSGGPEEAVVMGSIDAGAVEAALLAHRDEFRNCYEREINAEHPDIAGRIGTMFVIGAGGHVTEAAVQSTTMKNANVERCVIKVIQRIDFPIPNGGGVVQVTYPFKFSPVGH